MKTGLKIDDILWDTIAMKYLPKALLVDAIEIVWLVKDRYLCRRVLKIHGREKIQRGSPLVPPACKDLATISVEGYIMSEEQNND